MPHTKTRPEMFLEPGQYFTDFTYGEFSGYASREEARPEKWNGSDRVPARPECWSVRINGVDRAWREVRLPLKRGRTLKSAIAEACGMFASPEDIRPVNDWLGGVIDKTAVAS